MNTCLPALARHLPVLLLAACAASPEVGSDAPSTAAPAPSFSLPALAVGGARFERRVLGNGLVALAARDDAEPTVSVFVVYAVGKRMEGPLTTGLAHLTEHALYTGTARTPAGGHDARIQALGGESNAFTREDTTLFYDHRLPLESLAEVLAMEADRMRGLVFDEDAFLHERFRLDREERRDVTAAQRRAELVESLVFQAHPYGAGLHAEDGRTRAASLDLATVRAFYDRWYRPDRVAVVVVGALAPERSLAAVEEAFGALAAGPPAPAMPDEPEGLRGGTARIQTGLSRQRVEHLWLGPSVAEGEPAYAERVALELLATHLATEKTPDGTPVECSMGGRVDADLFALATSGPEAEATLAALGASAREALPASDLERARRRLLDELAAVPLRGRPYFSLAASVGTWAALGHPDYPAARLALLERLGPEDVQRAARRWLPDERRWSITLLATEAEAEPLPDDPQALQELAQDAAEAGDYERAIAAYDKLLAGDPNKMMTVIYLYSKAELHERHGALAAAKDDLEAALELTEYPAVRSLLDEVERQLAEEGTADS